MFNRCQREVDELHQFFEDWFMGQHPKADSMLERVSDVLAVDFQLITPEGHLLSREDLMDQLRKSHGSQSHRQTYVIEIQNFAGRSLSENGNIFLTTYEEHQFINDEVNVRLSSSVFRLEPNAPNQVEWIHVHEVWI